MSGRGCAPCPAPRIVVDAGGSRIECGPSRPLGLPPGDSTAGWSTSSCTVTARIPKGCGPAGCFCGVEKGFCATISAGGGLNVDHYTKVDCT